MQGWVKTHRCIMTKGIWENAHMFKVFSWCIMKASHKDRKQLVGRTTVELKRGQFVTGRKKASIELNMKESTAWDYLKVLENNESINIKSNSKFSIVTVENYSFYQSEEEKSDSKHNSKSDNKSTTNQQQINTNKNVKNVKNEKKDIYRAFDHLSITKEEYEKLKEIHKGKDIDGVLDKIENFAGNKKYKSLYLTANNWLKKEKVISEVKPFDKSKGGGIPGVKVDYEKKARIMKLREENQ